MQQLGIEINIPEGSKITSFQLTGDFNEYKKSGLLPDKSVNDYLKEFLGTKKIFDSVNKAFVKAMKESLPIDIKSKCLFCMGKSTDKADKACERFYLQMQITFHLAATEFVNIILAHRIIYENKKALLEVTIQFFKSLVFIKGEGKMFFDLDEIGKHILNAGFLSLSEMFANSEPLNNLKLINNGLDRLEQMQLENELFKREDENYLQFQQRFLESKQRFYKEQLEIQDRQEKSSQSKNKKHKPNEGKPSIPQLVLFYYYLQQAKEFPNFDNHPDGKLKAIEEVIAKDGINASVKYFQMEYNKIVTYRSNRVAYTKAKTILFVANNLLKDYPSAQKIALAEYRDAKSKK